MNINYKEPQFELFPANSATMEDINKPKFLLATLSLSTESLVILVILAIMIGLFSFSLGVERGKHLSAQALDEKVAAAWNVGGRRLAVNPVVVAPAVANSQVSPTGKTTNNVTIARAAANSKTATAPIAKATTLKPVVAKPATVKAPMVPAIGSGKWTAQFATYKSENYAKQEALGLKAKGYPVFIVKFKEFYLVCVGQFSSQAQAEAFLKKSNKQGSQVRRI